VAADSAVLNGSAIPGGEAASAWFRYSTTKPESCNDSFGSRIPQVEGQSLGAGAAAVAYFEMLSGLSAGTTYYYCAIAESAKGKSFGELVPFVAGAGAPSVTTDAATAVAPTGATISGMVEASGAATVWFRYGDFDPGVCDDSFGSRVPAVGGIAGGAESGAHPAEVFAALRTVPENRNGSRAFAALLTGLKPRSTYYYCAAASNQGGARFGKVRSFTTAAAPLEGTATPSAAPLDETASSTGAAVEPASASGCTYGGRASSPPLTLVSILPLLGLLLWCRRREHKARR